jgi:hypothetical protein
VANYVALSTSPLTVSPWIHDKVAFPTGGIAAFLAFDKIETALFVDAKELIAVIAALSRPTLFTEHSTATPFLSTVVIAEFLTTLTAGMSWLAYTDNLLAATASFNTILAALSETPLIFLWTVINESTLLAVLSATSMTVVYLAALGAKPLFEPGATLHPFVTAVAKLFHTNGTIHDIPHICIWAGTFVDFTFCAVARRCHPVKNIFFHTIG